MLEKNVKIHTIKLRNVYDFFMIISYIGLLFIHVDMFFIKLYWFI